MKIGMLWYDSDKNASLQDKVNKATVYYLDKYHKSPTLCFVHPSMMPVQPEGEEEKPIISGSVQIKPNQYVLPNHFWIGVAS